MTYQALNICIRAVVTYLKTLILGGTRRLRLTRALVVLNCVQPSGSCWPLSRLRRVGELIENIVNQCIHIVNIYISGWRVDLTLKNVFTEVDLDKYCVNT